MFKGNTNINKLDWAVQTPVKNGMELLFDGVKIGLIGKQSKINIFLFFFSYPQEPKYLINT